MALRMRKDIKKSSYYVWFLGAQESKGLRGAEYIHPVVKSLVQRERDVEPFKVTLQVSHKGLKIIQNIPPQAVKPGKGSSGKPEVVKHFIPHHAVTCVLQDEDIVSCILLLYNPVTKCPVHVHAYRCDSVETAEILRGQLQTLIERPENQKKLGEIETRLRAKGLLPPPPQQRQPVLPPGSAAPVSRRTGGGGSDGRSTSTRESESSGGSSTTAERLSGHQERIASLYDSLAAELREKLGTGSSDSKRGRRQQPHAPILLPPRDYDTVHRQKGNLTAIDLRRCLNTNIVGVNVQNTRNLVEQQTSRGGRGSSGGSSGIGSDHAPSPDGQDRESDPRYLDNQSSSDEEWNEQPSEDSLFLVQPSWRGQDLSLPRARRVHSSGIESPSSPSSPVANVSGTPPEPQAPAVFRRRRLAAEERQRSPSPSSSCNNNNNHHQINKKPLSPRERFKDAKEKFLLLEREELQRRQTREPPIAPSSSSQQPSRGKGYPVHDNWSRSRDSEDDLEDRPPRGYYGNDTPDGFDTPPEPDLDDEEEDVLEHGYGSYPHHEEEMLRHRVYRGGGRRAEGRYRERLLSPTRQPQHRALSREDSGPGIPLERYRSPMRGNPQPIIASPEMQRRADSRGPMRGNPQIGSPEMQRRADSRGPMRGNPQIGSPEMQRRADSRGPLRGNPQIGSPEMQRRADSRGPMRGNPQPVIGSPEMQRRADPRGPMRGNPQPIIASPEIQRRGDHRAVRGNPQPVMTSPEMQRRADPRIPRPGAYPDKKRRSMFDALEDERRRSSNELAKEFKRRSYQDGGVLNQPGYQELSEQERFPGLDRETARVQHHVGNNGGVSRYRHSYAEPHLHLHHYSHDILHRTNSSVSSGRVGIAAVHPY